MSIGSIVPGGEQALAIARKFGQTGFFGGTVAFLGKPISFDLRKSYADLH